MTRPLTSLHSVWHALLLPQASSPSLPAFTSSLSLVHRHVRFAGLHGPFQIRQPNTLQHMTSM